jgi:hypothetical protein
MTILATCHCGATSISLPHLPVTATSCNCSFCARTGALWGYFKPGELEFISTEAETAYSPGGLNNHHFCSKCGMQTWGDSPDWSSMYNADGTPKDGDAAAIPTVRTYAVNLNLVDNLDRSKITIELMDGRNNW